MYAMISSNRTDYGSASEWLTAVRKDECWLSQQQRLQAATTAEVSAHRDDALRRIGRGETYEFWEIYNHQVDSVVRVVWEMAELSLPKLKIQVIGMLSMEWLELHMDAERLASAESSRQKSAKPQKVQKAQKPRESMTLQQTSGLTKGHLTLLYQKLTGEGWIDGNEADFLALFAGVRDDTCQLTWRGRYGKGTLVELFRRLTGEGLVAVAAGFTLPAVLEGHFRDERGQQLTGLDKGNAANDKALPVIEECVRLLKINPGRLTDGGYDDDDEFESRYDPYDHQDLQLHKR